LTVDEANYMNAIEGARDNNARMAIYNDFVKNHGSLIN